MSENENKKIIIDEDWKSQVQAEKEQQKQPKNADATGSAQTSASTGGSDPDQLGGDDMQIPPASFPFLVSSIATQAMFALGQIPDPSTGQPMLDLDLAKHHIDMLAVLDEKTKGNLAADEGQMLSESLNQLRMGFVAIENQVAGMARK
jgi:hypothetical protein